MRTLPIKRIGAISALVVISLLLASGMAMADNSQKWYLTDTPAGIVAQDGTTHVGDDFMSIRAQPDLNPIYPINGSAVVWWYTECMAGCDVTFGEDTWDLDLSLWVFGEGILHAQVWSINGNGLMERLLAEGEHPVNTAFSPQQVTIHCYDYEPTQQTVLHNHMLALRLSLETVGGYSYVFIYQADGDLAPGILYSPACNPGYPLPELPAIVLLAGGLSCLGGYGAFRRWRTGAK